MALEGSPMMVQRNSGSHLLLILLLLARARASEQNNVLNEYGIYCAT